MSTKTPVTTAPRLALRPAQAAAALGIGRRKLFELTADRASGIPYIKLGAAVLYPVTELERWLREQAQGPRERRP